MRQMLKVVKNSDLDPEAGRAARPEQLLLQDDPNFMPDLAFADLAMDFDLNLEAPDLISDHESSQSSTLLSPHSLRMSPAPSLNIPTSGNDFYGYAGGELGGFSADDESRGGTMSSLAPGYVFLCRKITLYQHHIGASLDWAISMPPDSIPATSMGLTWTWVAR
jgi:hypothetical protein